MFGMKSWYNKGTQFWRKDKNDEGPDVLNLMSFLTSLLDWMMRRNSVDSQSLENLGPSKKLNKFHFM